MLVGIIMQRDVLTVCEGERLESVLRRMLERGVRHAPVLRDGRLVGIVSERNLLGHRARFRRDDPVGMIMTEHPYVTSADTPVASASAIMSTHKIGCLPVMHGERLLGIVTRTDMLTVLAQESVDQRPLRNLCAADVMQRNLEFVHASDCVLDAALRMLVGGGARQLPVLDGAGRVMGVVSERDVQRVAGDMCRTAQREALEQTSVVEVMRGDAPITELDTPLSAIARRLIDEQLGALLVVDHRQLLVGTVGHGDVLRALLPGAAAA